MLFWTIVKVGIHSLWANKARSLLAMLGIIIGTGAVIAMLAIGAGARQQILGQISSRGANLLIITPADVSFSGITAGTRENLTVEDALAITRLEGVRRVAPVIRGNFQVKFGNQNQRSPVIGSSATYPAIRAFEIDRGRNLADGDEEQAARVAIIGPTLAEELFALDDPLGQTIKVRGINFRVVGITKPKGDQGWFNPDKQVIIPFTTAMQQLFGNVRLNEINIQATDSDQLKPVQEQLTELLRQRHRLLPGMDNDFNVRNQADFITMVMEVNRTFTLLLGSTASISLLVGGIGIMNIMLVTVTERTREIGIRKAIGATEHSILLQFLLESLLITGLGGLIGCLLGVGTALLLPAYSAFQTALEPGSILLAFGFSAAVGIFFGWYPARRAAGLAPVEALRYE
ncbi:MAG: ABC transporter permease [Lentisphaeria bacterium]|jgi:ABC-type antimicrobial peptide transport system permease subunit